VTADYFVAPSVMVADGDVPTGLPLRFHMLIVYKTMMKYGAMNPRPRSSRGNGRIQSDVQAARGARLPQVSFAGALC
jgi:hypothetical protein